MNVSHDTTKEALNKITAALRKIVKAYKVYEEGMDLSKDQAMYSAEHLQKLADQKLEALVAAAQNERDVFDAQIKKAQEAELKNAKIIDFADPRVHGALETIQSARMTPRMIDLLVSAVIGEAAALDLIKEAFTEKGVEIPSYMAGWFFDPDTLFDNLEEKLYAVVVEPKNIIRYFEAQEEIELIGKILGIQNVDLNIGVDANDYAEQKLRAAMGL